MHQAVCFGSGGQYRCTEPRQYGFFNTPHSKYLFNDKLARVCGGGTEAFLRIPRYVCFSRLLMAAAILMTAETAKANQRAISVMHQEHG